MDCHRARNERRCHRPAAHGIEAPTESSSAPARPKVGARVGATNAIIVNMSWLTFDSVSVPKTTFIQYRRGCRAEAVCGHFLVTKPSLRSAALVVSSLMHRWRERLDGKTKRLARSRLAVCSRPRASTTFKTRKTSGAIRRAPRSERDKIQSDLTLAVARSAFPSRRFLSSKKAEPPILKGFLDQVRYLGMGIAGAANRTRTCDPVITNDVLYQLSYCGGPNAASGVSRKRPHLISGTAPIGKKNAGHKRFQAKHRFASRKRVKTRIRRLVAAPA